MVAGRCIDTSFNRIPLCSYVLEQCNFIGGLFYKYIIIDWQQKSGSARPVMCWCANCILSCVFIAMTFWSRRLQYWYCYLFWLPAVVDWSALILELKFLWNVHLYYIYRNTFRQISLKTLSPVIEHTSQTISAVVWSRCAIFKFPYVLHTAFSLTSMKIFGRIESAQFNQRVLKSPRLLTRLLQLPLAAIFVELYWFTTTALLVRQKKNIFDILLSLSKIF